MTRLATATTSHLAVGSSILGLITSGMYNNPLAIYREYIQNAVDALARSTNKTKGTIEVSVDPRLNQVRIRDNGPGLSHDRCLEELLPIGRSNKCIGTDRGFRGIGRLSGLAYATTVTFRTRSASSEPVTRVTWSGMSSSRNAWPTRAEDALQHCVTVETESGDEYPHHFFEAEVSGISRHAAGSLLNTEAVRSYISEVCPVPVSPLFPFAKHVENLFTKGQSLECQWVTLNDDGKQVHRQHEASIRIGENRTDSFKEFEEFRIPCTDSTDDAAIVWVAHSSYLGAIPKAAAVRGIRARVGNIQIGDETIFDHLFREDRFNRWCIGEVHILDPRIIPNGRRDYFEPGPHLRNLENHLGPIFRGLSNRCRTSSSSRNKEKKLLNDLIALEDTYSVASSGYLSDDDCVELVDRALRREQEIRQGMESTGTLSKHLDRVDLTKKNLRNFTTPKPHAAYAAMSQIEVATYQSIFHNLIESMPSISSATKIMESVLPIES